MDGIPNEIARFSLYQSSPVAVLIETMNTALALQATQIERRDLSPEGQEFRRFCAMLREAYEEIEQDQTYPQQQERRAAFISQLKKLSN